MLEGIYTELNPSTLTSDTSTPDVFCFAWRHVLQGSQHLIVLPVLYDSLHKHSYKLRGHLQSGVPTHPLVMAPQAGIEPT